MAMAYVILSLFCLFVLILLGRRMYLYRNMMFYRAAMRRRILALGLRLQRAQINHGRRRPVMWVYPRPQRWSEEMLENRVLDRLWKRNFRVTRGTFDFICRLVAQDIQRQNTLFRDAVPVPKRVAVALWRLGSGNSYRTISTTFGIGKATAVKICHEFCEAMNRMKRYFISLPSHEDDVKESIRRFAENLNFPQAIGAIDGTHIEIKSPTVNGADYFNRTQKYSMVTQAVVDHRMLFMDVSTGWPGSIHDARILRLSTFFTEMENGNILFNPSVTAADIALLSVATISCGISPFAAGCKSDGCGRTSVPPETGGTDVLLSLTGRLLATRSL